MEMRKVLIPTVTRLVIEMQEGFVNEAQYLTMTDTWKEWCADMLHSKVTLPLKFADEFFKVRFHKRKTLILNWGSPIVTLFDTPIEVAPGFRIIPGYTKYAVNEYGEVRRILYNNINEPYLGIPLSWSLDTAGYPTVDITTIEKSGKTVKPKVHRLVAFAWVDNPDPEHKLIVNHKDGNKQNPHKDNLEWVTSKENSVHAVQAGLRTDNEPCRVRVFETGEVKEFASVREAVAFMGLYPDIQIRNLVSKRKHKLIADKYEFRLASDNTPWHYKLGDQVVEASRYVITVTFPDGREDVTYGVRTFIKKYALWNMSNEINLLTTTFKERNPGCVVTWTDNFNGINPVQAYHLETGRVTEAASMRDLSRVLGIAYRYIHHRCNSQHLLPHDGYLFRFKSDQPWDLNNITEAVNQRKSILIHNTETGESTEVSSLREASRKLDVDRTVLNRRIVQNKPLGPYVLSYV